MCPIHSEELETIEACSDDSDHNGNHRQLEYSIWACPVKGCDYTEPNIDGFDDEDYDD